MIEKNKFFCDKNIVPAVMFHSVGMTEKDWIFSHLSETYDSFEEKMSILKRAGFSFIFWSEWYNHLLGKNKIKFKSVIITFDDGYLDNWVYVYPLLKKYGIKVTIFVNPEFVDSTIKTRPIHDPLRKLQAYETDGFLSWEEMRQMEASGLVDIQSHSLTHTWYFSTDEIIDFHHPNDKYPWLGWNARVNRKPYYIKEDQSSFVPFGTPIYKHEKSLICRRFYPSEKINSEMCYFVSSQEDNWWKRKNCFKILFKKWCTLKEKENIGYWETANDYKKRVKYELSESKRIISQQLNKDVNFICWPGGGYNQDVINIAKESGYKAWTLSSRDLSSYRNMPNANPEYIKRIGSSIKIYFRGKAVHTGNAKFFYKTIRAHQGCFISRISIQFYKLLWFALDLIKKTYKKYLQKNFHSL